MKTVHHLRRGSRRRCTPEDSRQRGLSLFLEHLDLHAVGEQSEANNYTTCLHMAWIWCGEQRAMSPSWAWPGGVCSDRLMNSVLPPPRFPISISVPSSSSGGTYFRVWVPIPRRSGQSQYPPQLKQAHIVFWSNACQRTPETTLTTKVQHRT